VLVTELPSQRKRTLINFSSRFTKRRAREPVESSSAAAVADVHERVQGGPDSDEAFVESLPFGLG
jgi:hypothetical protein